MEHSNRSLIDYYRCPEEMVRVEVAGELSDKVGFFRFGPDTTCYGECSAFSPSECISNTLKDAGDHVQLGQGVVSLPFDVSRVVDALRCEKYICPKNGSGKGWGMSSFVRTAYYTVRPLMPVALRKHLQRLSLRGWDKRIFPRWPVDDTVEQIMSSLMALDLESRNEHSFPFIWFWPNGAQACAVVTHDVETAAGRDFCGALMDIDDSYGIKASFQVVPESRYSVPTSYLQDIRGRGFEVNVHDLNHDGRLFENFAEFRRRVKIINDYAKSFHARGFRSGALYRNPDWFNLMEFDYDMSIPNVAHLDPQPGGCCTIFPYFIGNLLEIPLTAVQDYSLFNILGNYSIELWKSQISIILRRHGLMSFIVHPDYIRQEREQRIYRNLLEHLSHLRTTAGLWIVPPGEVCDWWRLRSRMKLIRNNDGWEIVGEGKERARLAYGHSHDHELTYSF